MLGQISWEFDSCWDNFFMFGLMFEDQKMGTAHVLVWPHVENWIMFLATHVVQGHHVVWGMIMLYYWNIMLHRSVAHVAYLLILSDNHEKEQSIMLQ